MLSPGVVEAGVLEQILASVVSIRSNVDVLDRCPVREWTYLGRPERRAVQQDVSMEETGLVSFHGG